MDDIYKLPHPIIKDDILPIVYELEQKLDDCSTIDIDLKDVKHLSPTTAYLIFGKLCKNFNDLKSRFNFLNDDRKLSSRILGAIDRKYAVLSCE
jgi:hypothetical protein